MMNSYDDYEVFMQEIHHTEKKDAPSGTAITLAQAVFDKIERKSNWKLKEEKSVQDDLSIEALREPNVPGTHSTFYESEMDVIEIKHTAKTRKAFALGAVIAAEWLPKHQGVFNMRDLLGL